MTQRAELLLKRLSSSFDVVHLPLTTQALPSCPEGAALWSLTRSDIEYSVVISAESWTPNQFPLARVESGWRAYYLKGPIPFSVTGVIARLTTSLAEQHIGCFVISTFDSDFVMIKSEQQTQAERAWLEAGIGVSEN